MRSEVKKSGVSAVLLILVAVCTAFGARTSLVASVEENSKLSQAVRAVEVRPALPQVVAEKNAAAERAENAATVFMLGLIFGMVSGIALFFLYVRRQENRYARHAATDYLFEDWPNRPARGLRNSNGDSQRSSSGSAAMDSPGEEQGDEMIEQPEPWERSVDWWKGDPED
jgi:hypothetical protein